MMQKIILPVLFCFLFFYSKGQKVLVKPDRQSRTADTEKEAPQDQDN